MHLTKAYPTGIVTLMVRRVQLKPFIPVSRPPFRNLAHTLYRFRGLVIFVICTLLAVLLQTIILGEGIKTVTAELFYDDFFLLDTLPILRANSLSENPPLLDLRGLRAISLICSLSASSEPYNAIRASLLGITFCSL